MRGIWLVFLFCLVMVGADYGAMSTQELLAIMNYTIEKKEQAAILKELKNRLPEMSKKEKDTYQKNLLLLKKKDAEK